MRSVRLVLPSVGRIGADHLCACTRACSLCAHLICSWHAHILSALSLLTFSFPCLHLLSLGSSSASPLAPSTPSPWSASLLFLFMFAFGVLDFAGAIVVVFLERSSSNHQGRRPSTRAPAPSRARATWARATSKVPRPRVGCVCVRCCRRRRRSAGDRAFAACARRGTHGCSGSGACSHHVGCACASGADGTWGVCGAAQKDAGAAAVAHT